MTRPVPEWIGKTASAPAPPRVKLRIIERQDGKCAACSRKLGLAGERVEFDHITALVLGGENREGNLRAVCQPCHRAKTAQDVAQKAQDARRKATRYGVKAPPRSPIPGSKASRWKRKMDGTVVPRE